MHLISTLSYEHITLQAKCGKIDFPISISEGPKPVESKSKLKTKTGLAEEGDITIKKPSQESSSSERTKVLDQ